MKIEISLDLDEHRVTLSIPPRPPCTAGEIPSHAVLEGSVQSLN